MDSPTYVGLEAFSMAYSIVLCFISPMYVGLKANNGTVPVPDQ